MNDNFTSESFFGHFQNEADALALPHEFRLSPGKVMLTPEIDSTNSYLLRKSAELSPKDFHLSLAAAESQTNGRGRVGRQFYSPSMTGIYFSLAFSPEGGVSDPAVFTVSAAVAVCRAIERLFGSVCKIKWVNDIYVGGYKVCGILTEGVLSPEEGIVSSAVIGIGINITKNPDQPSELDKKASGILGSSRSDVSRTGLLAACLAELLSILSKNEDIGSEYASRSLLSGQTVTVIPVAGSSHGEYEAKVAGITGDFGLRVVLPDGEERILRSGEVSTRINSIK